MPGDEKATVVIGLGEIGRPLHSIIEKVYPGTHGVDIEPRSISEPVGLMHVCFPFVIPGGFRSAVEGYAEKYRPEIIVIHSTVLPGTTREIEQATQIPCVYSPIRGKHKRMVEDLYAYTKFVAGANADAAGRVRAHLSAAGFKVAEMSAPESLELAKLLETTYFGLLIAWAQEVNRFAGELDGDYFEIARFFEEIGYLPPVTFQPGYIGGHCVMQNIALLQERFKSDFLEAICNSNDLREAELRERSTAVSKS